MSDISYGTLVDDLRFQKLEKGVMKGFCPIII